MKKIDIDEDLLEQVWELSYNTFLKNENTKVPELCNPTCILNNVAQANFQAAKTGVKILMQNKGLFDTDISENCRVLFYLIKRAEASFNKRKIPTTTNLDLLNKDKESQFEEVVKSLNQDYE